MLSPENTVRNTVNKGGANAEAKQTNNAPIMTFGSLISILPTSINSDSIPRLPTMTPVYFLRFTSASSIHCIS